MLSAGHYLSLAVAASCIFASTTLADPTRSSHDPFRAIALQIPKQPEPPICCLKSQSSQLETSDEEILLSFEEWKVKKLHAQAVPDNRNIDQDNTSNPAVPDGTAHDPIVAHQEGGSSTSHTYEVIASIHPAESTLPQLQVPTTDRFNYASLDCSARVHTAHRSAKSSSSILSSKKDRYMLSPCKTKEKQFVVVELCDDIHIDTVQLANYEFFSGVFKDFSVSVAKTYTDSEGWTHAGTYRARNVRGVQTFRFPDALRDFYRYLRIDFHSHYGNEYYCPLSLLRVYGLTHLEDWKWDMWKAESRAKQVEALKLRHLAIASSSLAEGAETLLVEDSSNGSGASNAALPHNGSITAQTLAKLSDQAASLTKTPFQDLNSSLFEASTLGVTADTVSPTPARPSKLNPNDSGVSTSSIVPSPDILSNSKTLSTPPPPSSSNSTDPSLVTQSAAVAVSAQVRYADDALTIHPLVNASLRSSSQGSSSVTIVPLSSTAAIPSGPSLSSGGESVYRVIMNKVASLETNYTLYTLYMEQQNSAVRELIKRLGEDIGRLEAVTRAQRATSQKMLAEWEKQRQEILVDYAQLVSRVENLSEEILLEKRLGVAQLCLMLAVLVFMGLTRGSRGEPVVVPRQISMREWGKRHLSLSGDWTTRFRRRSSVSRPSARSMPPPPVQLPTPSKSDIPLPNVDRVEFPKGKQTGSREPLAPIHFNSFTPHPTPRIKKVSHTRARTPSIRSNGKRTQQTPSNRPATPTPLRFELRPPILQRSSSHGAQLSVDRTTKSVKKWARTAHLHPVKSPLAFSRVELSESQNSFPATDHPSSAGGSDLGDVFSRSHVDLFAFPRGTKDRKQGSGQSTGRTTPEDDAENNWIDTDGGSELDIQDFA